MSHSHEIEQLMRDSYPALRIRLMAAIRKMGSDMSEDDVEDAIQDAFMLLYEDDKKYANLTNPPGFLYVTALYYLRNKHRVNLGRAHVVVDSVDSDNWRADYAALKSWEEAENQTREIENRQEMLEQIKNCIDEAAYQFLVKYYSDDLTASDIASQYSISEGAVWKRKERLLKKVTRRMFNMIFAFVMSGCMPFATLISEGGVDHDKTTNMPEFQPRAPKDKRMSPLTKEDAEIVLSFLQRLPPDELEDIDMRLVDICYSIIDDQFGSTADRGNVRRAIRTFKRRIVELEEKQTMSVKTRRTFRKRAIIAFIILGTLLFAAVAYSLGWLPWLFFFARDSEQYRVSIHTGDQQQGMEDFVFMPTGLDNRFDDLLREYDLCLPLPTWLPNGFVFDSAEIISDDETDTNIRVMFVNGNESVFIEIIKYHDIETQSDFMLEKDDMVYEEIDQYGQHYILYSNVKRMNAFWYAPPFTCIISTGLTKGELTAVIKSIPERSRL